jgi:Flp pilus assembly protein TadG
MGRPPHEESLSPVEESLSPLQSDRPRRAGNDRGAAAVEMAIVLPLLLLILFGIIDFGLMLNRQLLLTEAAREGARAAALDGSDATVRDRVEAVLGSAPSTIQVSPCPAGPSADADASVSLSYAYQTKTPLGSVMLLFGSSPGDSFTLTATGVMSCVG